jgi:acyl carrier protein
MKSPVQALVHRLVATHLHLDQASIADAKGFNELGVDALDLLFLALRLEDLDRGRRDFPVDLLLEARTVGEFVALVSVWLQEDESTDADADARRAGPCVARL